MGILKDAIITLLVGALASLQILLKPLLYYNDIEI